VGDEPVDNEMFVITSSVSRSADLVFLVDVSKKNATKSIIKMICNNFGGEAEILGKKLHHYSDDIKK
jgi:Mg-chelatase subunit ChlD